MASTWDGSSTSSSTGPAGRVPPIDFGGFLGVGGRKIVVDWNALQFDSDNGPISLALTRDQVKAAPEYRDGKPVEAIGVISQFVAPDM